MAWTGTGRLAVFVVACCDRPRLWPACDRPIYNYFRAYAPRVLGSLPFSTRYVAGVVLVRAHCGVHAAKASRSNSGGAGRDLLPGCGAGGTQWQGCKVLQR